MSHSHNHCHNHEGCCNHDTNNKGEIVKLVIAVILFILSFIFRRYSLIFIFISYILISFNMILDVAKNIWLIACVKSLI
jgi:hypothetical protein